MWGGLHRAGLGLGEGFKRYQRCQHTVRAYTRYMGRTQQGGGHRIQRGAPACSTGQGRADTGSGLRQGAGAVSMPAPSNAAASATRTATWVQPSRRECRKIKAHGNQQWAEGAVSAEGGSGQGPLQHNKTAEENCTLGSGTVYMRKMRRQAACRLRQVPRGHHCGPGPHRVCATSLSLAAASPFKHTGVLQSPS